MDQTHYLRPSSDSSLNHSTSSGSTGYNLMSEETADDDSSYIYGSGSSDSTTTKTSKFQLSANIGTTRRLMSAKLVVRARATTTSNVDENALSFSVGSNSSSVNVDTTSYTNYELALDVSGISYSGSTASATLTLTTTLSTSKNSINVRITQAYIELVTKSAQKWNISVSSKGTGSTSGQGAYYDESDATLNIYPNTLVYSCKVDGVEQRQNLTFNSDHLEYPFTNITTNHQVDIVYWDYCSKARFKMGDSWHKARKMYQKTNGVWSVVDTIPWTSDDEVSNTPHSPWILNKKLTSGDSIGSTTYQDEDDENFMTTPFIPIMPYKSCRIIGVPNESNKVMFNTYIPNQGYYDYWGCGEYVSSTVDGVSIYDRTLDGSKVVHCPWVKVNIHKSLWNYCKVYSNGTLVFDGSCFPIS